MDDDRRWSPLVWILPAAVGLFFWPTVLIFLYQQVIADYLSNRSIIGLVFSWIFGIPIAMMAISLVMLVPYILGTLVVGLAGLKHADQAYYSKDSNHEPARTAGSNPN